MHCTLPGRKSHAKAHSAPLEPGAVVRLSRCSLLSRLKAGFWASLRGLDQRGSFSLQALEVVVFSLVF